MEIQNILDQVDGWLSEAEGKLLYNLAQNCLGNGVIVEIGSWKGRSTICLGLGSKNGNSVKVYAIDPHTGNSEHRQRYGHVWTFDEFQSNIAKMEVDNIIVPLVKTSEEAARDFDKPVEFIFIDGAHEYESVKKDFELWYPKLVNGGKIALHDVCYFPGPKAVADEFIYQSNNFNHIGAIDSIVFATKA